MRIHTWRSWATLLLITFLGITLGYPLISVLSLSLNSSSDMVWINVLTDSYYLNIAIFTFWQAAASTVLTLLIGLPSAYVFARYNFPGKHFLRGLTTVPFVMPPLVIALGFALLAFSVIPAQAQRIVHLGEAKPISVKWEKVETFVAGGQTKKQKMTLNINWVNHMNIVIPKR